ncbi:hypothetical protein Q3G72_003867 [Acer saccharum]|nr:hypothetical protein Q3G72_003867 [Acer saccharum]
MSKEDDNNNYEEENENRGDPREIGKNDLVVATLIATVTFTAGFTLSGGFVEEVGPDQGTCGVLLRSDKKLAISACVVLIPVLIFARLINKPVPNKMTDAAAGSESYINNNNDNIEETVASSSNNQEQNFELLDSVYSATADGDIDKFQQPAGVLDQILTP